MTPYEHEALALLRSVWPDGFTCKDLSDIMEAPSTSAVARLRKKGLVEIDRFEVDRKRRRAVYVAVSDA